MESRNVGDKMETCPHPAEQWRQHIPYLVHLPGWLPQLLALTKLIRERQSEGGLLQGPFQQGSMLGASSWRLPVWLWDRQMAELPCGVGRTPALVPANAAASIQTGDLAEICNNTQGDWQLTSSW